MTETSTQSSKRHSLPMQGVPQPRREDVLNLPRVHISTHPVMAHKMTALRDKNTQPPEFYRLVKEMTVEGFYSSRVGLMDVLEYKGLTFLPEFPGCTHPEHQT